MQSTESSVSASYVAVLGLLTLATAMGIGRFAFTPLLPLMQKEYGVTLAQGAWLATSNYLGYFMGAAASFALAPKPGASVRYALVVVAATTAAMAVTESHWMWLCLRFAAGVASAFALIGASAWTLSRLSERGCANLSGRVFSGVGVGIVLAGAVALGTAGFAHGATAAWLLLGGCAALVAILGWPRLTDSSVPQGKSAETREPRLRSPDWWLIVCYGAFGFGYIIPATFIPAMASQLVDDPWIFGWAWPFFGAAAAASTVLVTRLFQNTPPRTVMMWSLLVMAAGVQLPATTRSMAMIIAASLCVGGTFMVMTMAGFQEARRLSSIAPGRLIAAMTAAFAIGQLIGPMLVGLSSRAGDAIATPSFVAFVVLIATATVLRYGPRR